MARVLIVVSGDLFVRNYLTTDALDTLEKEHECYYLAGDDVTNREPLEKKQRFLGYYRFPEELRQRHQALFNILMWRFRKRSSSFRFRFRRVAGLHRLGYQGKPVSWARRLAGFAYGNLFGRASAFRSMLYGNRVVYPIVGRRLYQDRLPICDDLQRHVRDCRPDLIVFPSSAYDPDGSDLARIGRLDGMKTLFLIDNWDNLSSKSTFWALPDHIAVWGEQSKEQAIRIQGFSPDQVTPIGTPRFDQYYLSRDRSLANPFDSQYVLFVGQAIPFDENAALRLLEDEISTRSDTYGALKVVYRPHPWRHPRISHDHMEETQYHHVVMDPQLRDAYYGGNTSYQPELAYYPTLLQNAKFVVATPTTMLIESLLFRKRALVLAYDDGIHLTSPHNALANYEHLRGIDQIEGVSFCRDIALLAESFRALWDTHAPLDVEKQARDLGYFLFDDGDRYCDRLAKLVRQMI